MHSSKRRATIEKLLSAPYCKTIQLRASQPQDIRSLETDEHNDKKSKKEALRRLNRQKLLFFSLHHTNNVQASTVQVPSLAETTDKEDQDGHLLKQLQHYTRSQFAKQLHSNYKENATSVTFYPTITIDLSIKILNKQQ